MIDRGGLLVASFISGSRPIDSVEAAAAWLEGLINVEKQPDVPYARLGLDPIRKLLERLENPHLDLDVIHIAGSKGKGSTALFTESICRAAGERVGTFTSPHLERWTERFRIDGREVAGDRLAAAVARLRPEVEWLRADDRASAPTFFDAITAAAFLLFAEAKVDRVVLEVGLGGRLDSTNIATPRVACVTSIELEHTDKLGGTLAAIAFEKAGILKPGVPAVAGRLLAAARDVVSARAREVGATVAWLGEDFSVVVRDPAGGDPADRARTRVLLRDAEVACEVDLPVLGSHQADNAALALACARRAGVAANADLADAARRGLERARLPGRVEVLGRAPLRIADGAHTAVSARALAAALARLPHRDCRFVLSVSAGKDTAGILEALLPLATTVTATCVEPLRSLSAPALATLVRAAAPGLELLVEADPISALRAARATAGPDDLVCATGSVYLAGLARNVLGAEGANESADRDG